LKYPDTVFFKDGEPDCLFKTDDQGFLVKIETPSKITREEIFK